MLKRYLSQLTLILMLVAEILIPVIWFDMNCSLCIKLVFGAGFPVVLIAVPVLIGLWKNIFKLPHADLLKRMISSNVRNVTLAVFILLFFLAQITWLMDSAYSMLFDFSSDRFPQEMTAFLLSGVCMIISMIIYPYAPAPDFGLDKRKKIYSAISFTVKPEKGFNWNNADLLFKPFFNTVKIVNSESSEYLFSIEELNVLLSDSFDFKKGMVNMSSFREKISDLDEKLKSAGIESIEQEESIDEEIFNKFLHIVLKYKVATQPGIEDTDREKLMGQAERLKICWHPTKDSNYEYKVSYNDFKETFETIQRCLSDKETGDTDETLLYISPGTSITASAFSALSLRGSRLILYVNQGNGQLMAINPNTEAVNEYLANEIKDE